MFKCMNATTRAKKKEKLLYVQDKSERLTKESLTLIGLPMSSTPSNETRENPSKMK